MNDKCLVCNEHAEEGHDCSQGTTVLFKEILKRLTMLEGRVDKLEGKKDEDMADILADGLFNDMYGKMTTGMEGGDKSLMREFLKKAFLMGKQVEKVETDKKGEGDSDQF